MNCSGVEPMVRMQHVLKWRGRLNIPDCSAGKELVDESGLTVHSSVCAHQQPMEKTQLSQNLRKHNYSSGSECNGLQWLIFSSCCCCDFFLFLFLFKQVTTSPHSTFLSMESNKHFVNISSLETTITHSICICDT